MLLEICAYNIASCIVAEANGADRIELCADPAAGGVTPSYGMVAYCLERLSIPVFPMVRPRGGNFLYDEDEIAVIKKDVMMFRDMGCPGIATGMNHADHTINGDLLASIVEWAGPMEVTCHKVFDRAPDAMAALDAVIKAGCKRVLTSGLASTATDGAGILQQMREAAGDRLIVMPGGGVRASNLELLMTATGCKEFHSSGLNGKSTNFLGDAEEIKQMRHLLKQS